MTDLTVKVEEAIKAPLDELKHVIKSNTEEFNQTAESLKTKLANLETETKSYGTEFGDTKAKVSEISAALADLTEQNQKANAAIDRLTAEIKAPGGDTRDEDAVVKSRFGRDVRELTLKQHTAEFLRTKHFGEDDDADEFDATKIPDDAVEAYRKAVKLFWSKAMRTRAAIPMVEHSMTNDELKAIEPLLMKKSISTVSHGSRYWLTNEMYGEIIACYDEATDLSRLFSQVSISRGAIEVMKDNDVEKRALFKCEIDCEPGKAADTPRGPGTEVIPTFELYDRECITHTMLEDSEIDLESWLVPRVAEGFSRGRNEKFMWGNGTTEPKGLLQPGNHIEMPSTSIANSPAGQFTWQHLRIMPFQLAKKFQAQGSYMFSRDALMALFTIADGDGKPMIDQYLMTSNDGVMRLWGYPVTQVDQLPNYLSSSGVPVVGAKPIGFGAWHAAYLVVNRKGFFVVRDPAYNPCGVTWHFGQRVGGGVLCENASVFLRIV